MFAMLARWKFHPIPLAQLLRTFLVATPVVRYRRYALTAKRSRADWKTGYSLLDSVASTVPCLAIDSRMHQNTTVRIAKTTARSAIATYRRFTLVSSFSTCSSVSFLRAENWLMIPL